jgi:hypothetical protein
VVVVEGEDRAVRDPPPPPNPAIPAPAAAPPPPPPWPLGLPGSYDADAAELARYAAAAGSDEGFAAWLDGFVGAGVAT